MAGEGGEQVTVAVGFSKVKCAQLSAQLVLRNNKYDSLLVSSRLVSKKKTESICEIHLGLICCRFKCLACEFDKMTKSARNYTALTAVQCCQFSLFSAVKYGFF